MNTNSNGSNAKVFKDADGNELSGDALKAYRSKIVKEVLAADQAMDQIVSEMNEKLEAAKLLRSNAIEALVGTGVEKFKHPEGYVLTPSRKEKTADGIPGIYFLRGKPKVEKADVEVFDLEA